VSERQKKLDRSFFSRQKDIFPFGEKFDLGIEKKTTRQKQL